MKFGFILPGPEKLHEKTKAQSHGTGNRAPPFSVTCTSAFLLALLVPVPLSMPHLPFGLLTQSSLMVL